MTTLRNLHRFLFPPQKDSTRSKRRASPLSTGRGIEILEGRELLSAITAASVHDRATIHGRAHGAAVTDISYYPATSITLGSQPVSGWQGIRAGDTAGQYLITGTSDSDGLLYIGTISGQGTTYAVNYPGTSVSSSSVYGPNNLGGGNIQLVGTYRYATTTSGSPVVNSFLFQGTTADLGTAAAYTTIDYPGATYTYLHSIAGGLTVGNYDSPTASGAALGPGKCFVYNLATSSFTSIVFPGSVSDSAYGIWYNGGNSYTICGGFSDKSVNNMLDQDVPIGEGYLVDYNSATGQFSHWQAYNYPAGADILTHFQGISSPAPGVYTLSADSVQIGSTGPVQGSFVIVHRNPDGSFGSASWVSLHYPDYMGLTSNDSVFDNQVVGVLISGSSLAPYQATVNADVPSATALGGHGHGHGHRRHHA